MLEFSRKHQEDQVVQEIEDDVKHLTQEQADLEVLLLFSVIVNFLCAVFIYLAQGSLLWSLGLA